jgi:hypothetical protein
MSPERFGTLIVWAAILEGAGYWKFINSKNTTSGSWQFENQALNDTTPKGKVLISLKYKTASPGVSLSAKNQGSIACCAVTFRGGLGLS